MKKQIKEQGSEVSHTPGPWELVPSSNELYRFELVTPTLNVCEISFPESEKADANARLIAAAPEMLAALELADAYINADDTEDVSVDSVDRVIKAAIAKATGKGA